MNKTIHQNARFNSNSPQIQIKSITSKLGSKFITPFKKTLFQFQFRVLQNSSYSNFFLLIKHHIACSFERDNGKKKKTERGKSEHTTTEKAREDEERERGGVVSASTLVRAKGYKLGCIFFNLLLSLTKSVRLSGLNWSAPILI